MSEAPRATEADDWENVLGFIRQECLAESIDPDELKALFIYHLQLRRHVIRNLK